MRTVLGETASLAAPPGCGACGARCPSSEALCRACLRELLAASPLIEPGPPGVDLAVAVAPFDGVARRLVHGLKYGRRLALAGTAAGAMARACPESELHGEVVPVPPAPWRWLWRGFDPAEELALALSGAVGLAYAPCLRRGRGARQVGRRRARRLADPPLVWAPKGVPRHALLVDDVHTTGATLSACARALRAGGSERIVALALARA